jgi:nucleoside-diphosphate-sugar epimerase
MKRVLLTGASGFIGRHCIEPLATRGYEIHAVSSRTPPFEPAATWHQVDLLAPGRPHQLVASVRPSHLLHLAWCATPGVFWTSAENVDWVGSTLDLLRAFASVEGARFVGAGTCAEYVQTSGDCDERHTPLEPSTLYGSCKHAVHAVLQPFAEGRFSAAWGRIFHLFGPHEHPDRLVPSVIRSLLEGRPALCTSGTQLRDFLYVQDVADAFAALLDTDVAGPVNIASGTPLTVADLVGLIGRQMDAEGLVHLGARPIPATDPPRLTAAVSRLRVEVGWRPSYDLDRGLADTIAWWRSIGAASPRGATRGLERADH